MIISKVGLNKNSLKFQIRTSGVTKSRVLRSATFPKVTWQVSNGIFAQCRKKDDIILQFLIWSQRKREIEVYRDQLVQFGAHPRRALSWVAGYHFRYTSTFLRLSPEKISREGQEQSVSLSRIENTNVCQLIRRTRSVSAHFKILPSTLPRVKNY